MEQWLSERLEPADAGAGRPAPVSASNFPLWVASGEGRGAEEERAGTWPPRTVLGGTSSFALGPARRRAGPRPADPWEEALHRTEKLAPPAMLTALRAMSGMTVDDAEVGRMIEMRRRNRRQGDEEAIAASIARLSVEGFRSLVADLFRREGYVVMAGDGPDADVIDLEVTRGRRRWLVNCQLRDSRPVELAALIEMARVTRNNQASGAFLFACGQLPPQARAYARSNSLVLIDWERLLNMVVELTLEDLRKETLGRRLAKLRHPERGHELRHALLASNRPIGRP